ncbi:MAG: hypothetical protein PHU51_01375 [Candidatus Nanoarchaeia archaeon]|nr:hypothetical protein [Candidatus Nanoarchaeia archaeon]
MKVKYLIVYVVILISLFSFLVHSIDDRRGEGGYIDPCMSEDGCGGTVNYDEYETNCSDNIDNDGDGYTDKWDFDCKSEYTIEFSIGDDKIYLYRETDTSKYTRYFRQIQRQSSSDNVLWSIFIFN